MFNLLKQKRYLAVACILFIFCASPAIASNPRIVYPVQRDINVNGVDDALETVVARTSADGDSGRPLRIIVTLYNPPTHDNFSVFRQFGGKVGYRYTHATYGFSGTLPADRVADFAESLGGDLCIIESDVPGSATLDDSARHTRVRPLVWSTAGGYGLDGDPNIVIAIFDSGIDTTHTDLSGGRLVYWRDFTTEGKVTSTDQHGHGSHVAGISSGTGAVMGSGAVTSLTTTMSGRLPATNGYGYSDMIKVPVVGTGLVTSNLLWSGSGTAQINLATSDGTWLGAHTSSTPPLTWTWSISSADIYKARAGNSSGLGGRAYSMLVTHPYTAVGDGFNLFRGIAPATRLAGVKILDQTGAGWASEWTAAFDSVAAINTLYNIKVANASVGLNNGASNTALNNAVNNLVSSGTVVVISAGNDYGSFTVPDPGLAAKAITVGSINDYGAMTDYSSNGPQGSGKPDVVAPGGSHSWGSDVGTEITSVDTNVNDGYSTTFSDRQSNDYTNMYGTSMASPTVAGIAALIIDALAINAYTWGFSEYEALKVKMLIQMTATETNTPGEELCGNNPTLDRGGKDLVEGYGKVNADAAIEAVKDWLEAPPDTSFTIAFGPGPFERKCWATQLGICGPDPVTIKLDVPAGADLDLYLYNTGHTGDGEPQIEYSSTTAGLAADESVTVDLDYICNPYYLVVKHVSGGGTATLSTSITITGVAGPRAPRTPVLGQNYPNPFGPGTTIPYAVPAPGAQPVTLRVYDVTGALVKTLVENHVDAGIHKADWNGTDNDGHLVASGVYFARYTTMGRTITRRMTIIR